MSKYINVAKGADCMVLEDQDGKNSTITLTEGCSFKIGLFRSIIFHPEHQQTYVVINIEDGELDMGSKILSAEAMFIPEEFVENLNDVVKLEGTGTSPIHEAKRTILSLKEGGSSVSEIKEIANKLSVEGSVVSTTDAQDDVISALNREVAKLIVN